MADQQIEQLTALAALADGDQLLVNDVSDTTDDAGGTVKRLAASVLSAFVLASEADPVFLASPAGGIEAGDITNWDTAYGWGDHATEGYLKNVSEDTTPQLGGDLDAAGNTIHFGTTENEATIDTGPSPNTCTVSLGSENHWTIPADDADDDITATVTVPPGPCAGTIIVVQGATARDITWSPSAGSVTWLGTEPTWSSDTSKTRIVAWRWNGSVLYLSATDTN